jgi:hypothetical protein
MRSLKYLILTVFLLTSFRISASETWVVPDDQKSITAPEKFTPEMQKAGEQVYIKNCQSCHGMPGKDNWMRMTPPPGDLSKEQAQKNTDGELFYKITAGKAPMPEFRNIIPENDRWDIVAYIRSFNPGYVQPEPAALADFSGRIVSLAMSWNESMKKLVITATEKMKDGSLVPAAGVEVILYAKRYFGNLPVGDPKITPANGQAIIDFPTDLPGNKDGMVDLVAKVNDPRGQMKTTPASGSFAIGKPTDLPGLTETRAWWTTRDKAPLWIVAVYTGSVIIVWGFIFYILFLILKIRKIS